MALGMDRVREHERELLEYALPALAAAHPELTLYGPMDPAFRGGVIPFNIPGIHPHDVAQVLDRSGVAVRAGHHCTMPLHERLDLAATARASFNVYTTRSDIDALVAGIGEVEAGLRGLSAIRPAARPCPTAVVADCRLRATLTASMDDLYRDYILEHYRRPHNFGVLENARLRPTRARTRCAAIGSRSSCRLADGKIAGVGFTGRGCAISQASASLLTDEVKGKQVVDAAALTSQDVLDLLGIEICPARLKCALLSLDTLQQALADAAVPAAAGNPAE